MSEAQNPKQPSYLKSKWIESKRRLTRYDVNANSDQRAKGVRPMRGAWAVRLDVLDDADSRRVCDIVDRVP
jgi:hypothetical protein